MSMFEALAESVTDDWLPETPEWEESEKLAREKEALGVYLSGHPLDAFRHILKSWVKFTAADLPDTPDGESVALGVVVSAAKEKVGKKGGRVAILTVEDLTGSVEVLVFGDLLEKMAPWLSQPSLPLWLKGDVVQEDRGAKIVAREVAPLGTSLPRWPSRLDLRLRASTLTKDQLLALRQVLDRHHRHRARLSPLPEPPGKRHPGPPRGPGPHPLRGTDHRTESPLRLSRIEPVEPQFSEGAGVSRSPAPDFFPAPGSAAFCPKKN